MKCTKHKMPDGTIMDGPVHGSGQVCVEWDDYKKGGRIKGRKQVKGGRPLAREFSAGGMLVGPSHDNGGIPAIVDGVEPIEVEGGEFIINKQTVDAVGEEFLHKLNSTKTTHHQGGFDEGQLPSPSQYKDGGKVTRRNNMARGRRAPARRNRLGRAPARKMARGGNVGRRTTPRRSGKRVLAAGGMSRTCGGPGQAPCGSYARGGRTRPRPSGRKQYAHGGTHLNSSCRMHSGDQHTCQNTSGCRWNFSTQYCE